MACITKRRKRWVIDFYDQHGKRRWKTMPEGSTKKQARDELRAIEDQVAKRIYLPHRKVPIFSKVAKDWLDYKKTKVRANTWVEYERQTKIHFGELDDLKINRITISSIEKYISKREGQNMNINTLRRILVSLNQIMNYAVRHRYIDFNPVREAEKPRKRETDIEPSTNIEILNPLQIKQLLDATSEAKYKMLFMLASFSGARQGEILGLKWGDVEWDNSQIHIQRTFNYGQFFPPKSKTSDRRIDIGPKVLTELKKWKLACPKTDLDLIFPNNADNPMDHHQLVARHYKPALEDAELPNIRFHDLRHTFASLLIEQGENIKYIQSQLGHSSPTVTLNIYAHLMEPTNQASACRLEKSVFGEDGCKTVAEGSEEEGISEKAKG